MEEIVFNKLIGLVEIGLTIRQSFKQLHIHSSDAYKIMSKKQKLILKQAKMSHSTFGCECYNKQKQYDLNNCFDRNVEY